jgi:predicted Rossmann fold flavoprotein
VLSALLRGVNAAGAELLADHRVLDIERTSGGFHVVTQRGTLRCRYVVLATGGQSLPKTGSDGAGFRFAAKLGHTIVPTTPALAPLILDQASDGALNRALAGVSHDAELAVWVDGRLAVRLRGSLLWTHFGISGPVTLNAARHWLRAQTEGRAVRVTLSFCPDTTFEAQEQRWSEWAIARSKTSVARALATIVPASVASAVLERLTIDPTRRLAQLTRAERRSLVGALVESPLPVTGCRGYNFAEATAGGVTLEEIDPATMASRCCPGLYLVGEMLDVDGRIGGFNFQWAWSTGYLAGCALGARI